MADAGLRIVGAGLGRTGTHSLKLALERLLGQPCYHMVELFKRPQDLAAWAAAINGEAVDWGSVLAEYSATVDWPACAFWREIAASQEEPWILLSTRSSPEDWWTSFEATIAAGLQKPVPPDEPEWARRRKIMLSLLDTTFTPDWREREGAIAGYRRHIEQVRAEAPAGRLIEWQPSDGWEPICNALGIPLPDEPFPRTNSTAEFQAEQHAPE